MSMFEVGDQVATDTWTMHMDESVWGEDAREFRPERYRTSPMYLDNADYPITFPQNICIE